MTVEEVKQETEILLKITGRIDTNTSTQLQAEVLKSLQKMPNLTLDLKECDYVSSEGLRTFLIAQKTASAKGGKFKLKSICQAVEDILSKSGFTKYIEIEE